MNSQNLGNRMTAWATAKEVGGDIRVWKSVGSSSIVMRLFLFWMLIIVAGYASAQQQEANPVPDAFGGPSSVGVASALGALTDSIPIVVSTGRRQMEPKIILSYSSSSGQGLLGLGWHMDLGRVEKWRGDGTPAALSSGSYAFSLVGAGGELVDTGSGVYRAKLERAYRMFKRSGDGWEMFNGEGMVHRFGSSSASRIDGQRWLLDQVEDASGNTINYYYENTGGMVLPTEIRYTGHGSDPGAHSVVFEYEDRPDTRSLYSGFVDGNGPLREVISKRLASISVYAAGALTRRYVFEYQENTLNALSMLRTVALVGSDGSSRVTLRTIDYTERELGWSSGSSSSLPVDLADAEGLDTGGRIIDVNGDNYADAIDGVGNKIWLGTGDGGFSLNDGWSASLAEIGMPLIDENTADTGVRFTDVNSDGLPDIFIATPDRRQVWLNTGQAWQLSEVWTDSLGTLKGPVRYDPDFAGEAEVCTAPHCYGGWGYFEGCTPAHCTGSEDDPDDCVPQECDAREPIEGCLPAECNYKPEFSSETEEPLSLVGTGGESQGVLLADVNGDGRVDILWSMRSSEGLYYHLQRRPISVRAVYLNTGDGWLRHAGLSSALQGFDAFVSDGHVRGFEMLDVNADGLADIVRTRADQGEDERGIFLGTGHGWEADAAYTQSLFDEDISSLAYVESDGDVVVQSRGLTPADLNDDGLVDYVIANDLEIQAFRNTGQKWVKDDSLAEPFLDHDIVFVEKKGAESSGVVFANIDQDGLLDVVRARDGIRRIYYSSGMRSGLMVETTTTLGETTTIDWGVSADLDNRDSFGIERLPFNTAVVRSIHINSGRGSIYSTDFDYGGGLFEGRQFRGFAYSKEAQPTGLLVQTTHFQSAELAGQARLQETYDKAGVLREKLVVSYDIIPSDLPIKQILQTRTEQYLYESGTTRSTIIEYAFDSKMNPVSISKDPEVEVVGDETRTEFSWVVNEPAGIWSLPWQTTTYGSVGEKLTESIFSYDNLPEGQVTKGLVSEVKDFVEDSDYVTKTIEYDLYGNVAAYQDRGGNRYSFEYDDDTASFRTAAVEPEGRRVASTYDPRFGLETEVVDASGNSTMRSYDAFGRLKTITLPGDELATNGSRSYSYSPVGDPGQQYCVLYETQSPDNPETLVTVQYFDAMGKVYRVERPEPGGRTIVTTNEFDDKGSPVKMTLPYYEGDEPRVSVITRDEYRRPVHILDPDGYTTTFAYFGSRVEHVDRDGQTISYWRNIDGDIIKIQKLVDGEVQTTRYSYDALGRLTRVVDALGEETTFSTDALGRRTGLVDPNIGQYRYHYDDAGRLVVQVAPDNETTKFIYNKAGNLLEKQFPDGSTAKFTYGDEEHSNGVGRLVRVDDDAGRLDITYDVRGNVIQRRRQVHGDTFVTGYAYDSLSRLRHLTYPDGFAVDYSYNSLSNIDRITDSEGQVIASGLQYNASGQLLDIVFGNQISSHFSYGTMTQMDTIETLTAGGELLQDLAYSYDPRGNILGIEDGVSLHNQDFEYDEDGRLVKADGAYGEKLYQYDAIGNLLRKGNMQFEIDPLHPQRVVKASQVNWGKSVDEGAFEIAYDQRGNVTAKADQRFEYSAENRMTRIFNQKGKVLEKNVYDAQGQRIIHQTRSATTVYIDGIYERGKTHDSRHVYAGPMLVSTIVTPRSTVKLIAEVAPAFLGCATVGSCDGWAVFIDKYAGTLAASGAIGALLIPCFFLPVRVRRRMRKELELTGKSVKSRPFDSLIIAMIIPVLIIVSSVPTVAAPGGIKGQADEMSSATKRYYYHSNHLGSVNVVTDQNAAVVEKRDYTPYGERSGWTGPNSGPKEFLTTFNGQQYDDSSGLYYFGARYYDADLGRFLTADTLVSDPMDPKSLNRYAFAKGNPIRFSDPTGHSVWDVVFGVLAGVAAIITFVVAVVVTVASLGTLTWAGVILATMAGLGLAALAATVGGLLVGTGFGIWYLIDAMAGGGGASMVGFASAFFNGFLLGTVVALGVIAFVLSFLTGTQAVAAFFSAVLLGAVMGMAFGTAANSIFHFIGGGGPGDLLWPLISGIAVGGIFGAAGGALGFGASAGAVKLFGLGAKGASVLGALMGGGGLALEVVDSFALPLALHFTVGYGYSLGGSIQTFLAWPVLFSVVGIGALHGVFGGKFDSSFTNSEPWKAFFGVPTPYEFFNPQPYAQ